jgi:bacillithiol disulfide reductase
VIAAVGAWASPRKLDVPGDDLSKVRYRFGEPHNYIGEKVLVVGGRNSAIETALLLWRAGAEVSLSYRRDSFDGVGVKYWLKPDIDNRIANKEIHGYLGTNVSKIDWDTVTRTDDKGKKTEIENDFVIPLLGYNPPGSRISWGKNE